MKKTRKIHQRAKKTAIVPRKNFNRVLGAAAVLAVLGGGAAYKYFNSSEEYHPTLQLASNARLDSAFYLEANPAKQEKWVKDVLVRHSIDDLFQEVIIVTPQNADRYPEYSRERRVGMSAGDLLTLADTTPEDTGTKRTALPKLYIPTEAFRGTEGDLTSMIAFHEAKHAFIARNGFGFISMDYFWHNNHTLFDYSMFMTVNELEAHKEQLEKGRDLMSTVQMMETMRQYMAHYVQLWRYGANLRSDITESIKVIYFQPWMKETDSIVISGYEGERGIQLRYYGPKAIRFVTNGNIQFEFNYKNDPQLMSFPLPAEALKK